MNEDERMCLRTNWAFCLAGRVSHFSFYYFYYSCNFVRGLHCSLLKINTPYRKREKPKARYHHFKLLYIKYYLKKFILFNI